MSYISTVFLSIGNKQYSVSNAVEDCRVIFLATCWRFSLCLAPCCRWFVWNRFHRPPLIYWNVTVRGFFSNGLLAAEGFSQTDQAHRRWRGLHVNNDVSLSLFLMRMRAHSDHHTYRNQRIPSAISTTLEELYRQRLERDGKVKKNLGSAPQICPPLSSPEKK